MLEPGQLAALKAIEERTGAPVAEQIRRAIDGYLASQKTLGIDGASVRASEVTQEVDDDVWTS
jgi:hypothetical protein